MKKKKYISPTIPSNFIPCDWNEEIVLKLYGFDVDRYVRNDVEQIATAARTLLALQMRCLLQDLIMQYCYRLHLHMATKNLE